MRLVTFAVLVIAALSWIVNACAPQPAAPTSAPAATSAPAKPTEAAKPAAGATQPAAAPAKASGPVKLTVGSWSSTPESKDWITGKLIAGYQQQNPNATVEMV